MRFSARLAANQKKPLILEDAPKPMRIGYIKGILGTFVGNAGGYRRTREQPLDTSETHNVFIALIREESDPWDFDEGSAWGALTQHLKICPWPEFYDFMELVGKLLIKIDDEIPFDATYHFTDYQSKVNSLLIEDGIGWSLNDKSELHRQRPKLLTDKISSTELMLTEQFSTARIHYQKSVQYLYRHPIDEANSIKEIVSSVESIAKCIDPKISTLGDAIKKFRRDSRFSSYLLDALEKLYIYSNATPLVRHGHTDASRPSLAEAELALFIGVAYARYLIDVAAVKIHNPGDPKNATS